MKTLIALNYAELTTVLAALRTAQEDRPIFDQMPHFEDVDALDDEEIDELCETLNCGGDFTDAERDAIRDAISNSDMPSEMRISILDRMI